MSPWAGFGHWLAASLKGTHTHGCQGLQFVAVAICLNGEVSHTPIAAGCKPPGVPEPPQDQPSAPVTWPRGVTPVLSLGGSPERIQLPPYSPGGRLRSVPCCHLGCGCSLCPPQLGACFAHCPMLGSVDPREPPPFPAPVGLFAIFETKQWQTVNTSALF